MLAIITFIIILGVLIFVHELGHFVIARRNGIRADEFGFGFPPRIFGVQYITGKKREKVAEIESIEIKTTDIKSGKEEIIQETITEKIHRSTKKVPIGRWRIIWGRHDGDDEGEKKDLEEAEKNRYAGGTIYSINWIPLGGFVRIKGENGDNHDKDSFAVKSAWTRTKVLAAGVIMNFILAWFLITVGLVMGVPGDFVSLIDPTAKIKISGVMPGSPAEQVGLKSGDEILKEQDGTKLLNTNDLITYINAKKGEQIDLKIMRDGEVSNIKVTPRENPPEDQGPLGIAFDDQIQKYPWYEALWKGLIGVASLAWLMISTLFSLLGSLFVGKKITADITGPVGIAIMSKQAADAGLVSLVLFTSFLSINLGIINILPIPALDGGRIFFIIIEKIRGYPVSQKTEQVFHTTFFLLLIFLMVLVTFKDVAKLLIK